MSPVGGLRVRLVQSSLVHYVEDGLRAQGWFETRRHLPIQIITRPIAWDQPVTPNTLAITMGQERRGDVEMGSDLTEKSFTIEIDFYADNASVGLDLINDLRDILRGRIPAGGRPSFAIYDYTQATPTVIGYAVVNEMSTLRNHLLTVKHWALHWYRLHLTVSDTYYPEI